MPLIKRVFHKILKSVTPQKEIPLPTALVPLKMLNTKMAAIQWLSQDYSIPTMPQNVVFTTTTACNLKCPHCQTHGTRDTRKIYNRQRWPDNILDKVAKETLPSALNFGLTLSGEPLCIPQFGDKLKRLSLYGAKLDLTTNGTLFTKKTFCQMLPIIESVSISIDGATQLTCETIRAGSKFKDILTNIKILAQIRDTHFKGQRPYIQLAFTIMASNVKDMPEIVRLAHALKISQVTFFPIIVFFPHVEGEELSHCKALYRYYYLKTKEEMNRLNIQGSLPDLYPDVEPDKNEALDRSQMIIQELPEAYYDTLPPITRFTDQDKIKQTVDEVGLYLNQHESKLSTLEKESFTPEELQHFRSLADEKRQTYQPAVDRHLETLQQQVETEDKVKYCKYLYTTVFISIDGIVAPCCLPDRPEFGSIYESSIEEIWNSAPYNAFRKKFNSENPPKCCVDCLFLTDKPVSEFKKFLAR